MPDPVAVNSMFARIARRYDFANRLLSGGTDVWWRYQLLRAVRYTAPHDVLDLATGSGDVTFALARGLPPETQITGMDFCQPMLDEAEKKKARAPEFAKLNFKIGDGLALPLPDESFDVITVSFGLRNMADRLRALREMRRVLRNPHGKLFVLEFSQPVFWFKPVYYSYLKHVLPRLASLATGDRAAYDYLCGSIEQFPNRSSLSNEFITAGFSSVRSVGMTFGIVALHEAQV